MVTPQITQVSFGADDQLLQKLSRLKGLLAHKKPNIGTAELVNELCEMALKQLDPLRKNIKLDGSHKSKSEPELKIGSGSTFKSGSNTKSGQRSQALELESKEINKSKIPRNSNMRKKHSAPIASEVRPRQKRKYISTNVKKAVWQRANGQCENCQSQYALELDHLRPISLGGTDDLDNLRMLCRSCNQRAAIEKLGLDHMQQYLR